jgi:hypothetical protein
MGLRPPSLPPGIQHASLVIYSALPLLQQPDRWRGYPRFAAECGPGQTCAAIQPLRCHTTVVLPYNRKERERLADQQVRFIEAVLVKP